AHQLEQLVDSLAVDSQRIVAPVECVERGPEDARSLLRLTVADLLHALLGLSLFLPELARLAALAVREPDHVRVVAARDRTGGTPDEVRRVRADDQQPLRHWPAFSCS